MRLTIDGLEDCPCPMCNNDNDTASEKRMDTIAQCHPNALRKVLDEMEVEREEFITSLPPNTRLPERLI